LGRIQKPITMLPEVWKLVYENYEKLGYRRPTLLIEDCILYAFSNKFSNKLDKDTKARVKSFKKVGTIANEVKDIMFLANAGKIYKDTKRDLDEQVKAGILTREKADFELERLKKKLRESGSEIVTRHEHGDKEKREKRKRAVAKKYGYKVSKSGKIKKA